MNSVRRRRGTQGGESAEHGGPATSGLRRINLSRATNRSRKRMVSFAPLGPDLSGGIFFARDPDFLARLSAISVFISVCELRCLVNLAKAARIFGFCRLF